MATITMASGKATLRIVVSLVFLAIAFSLSAIFAAAQCVTPADDTIIAADTVLCGGAYNIRDAAGDGVFKIAANSVELNCKLASITGDSSGIGVNITGFKGVTVRNCIFNKYRYGIWGNTSVKLNALSDTFYAMTDTGVYLKTGSSFATISGNLFQGNSRDVFIDMSDSATIRGNNFTGATTLNLGLQLSKGHLVTDNTFSAKDYGIVFAIGANESAVTNNTFFGTGLGSVAFTVSGALSAFNNSIWMNRFYGKGVVSGISRQNFCVNGKGNYYDVNIPFANIGWNDCGRPTITGAYPRTLALGFQSPFRVNWTNQSSYPSNMSFFVEFTNGSGWLHVNFTRDLNTLFDTDTLPNLCSYRLRVTPWDSIVNATQNVSTAFCIRTRGNIRGKVKACDGSDLWNASIWLFNTTPWGLHSVIYTNGIGNYEFKNIRYGNYTLVVNYTGQTNARRNLSLASLMTETRNFNTGEVCPVTSDCESDCTRRGQDICDASCNGINSCRFQPACIGSRQGLRVFFDVDRDAICCTDARYVRKTGGLEIAVPGQDVVKLTSIVNFRDAFKYIVGAKMHVVVFKKRR